MSRSPGPSRRGRSKASADGVTQVVNVLRKTLPNGLRPAASWSPRTTKAETVKRHSATASSKITTVQLAGRKSVAASSFLFNAAPNSLSAATEAAVKDIASEILEVEDGHNVDQPSASWQVGHGAVARVSHSFKAPPDPWASSDDEPSPKAGQSENQRHVIVEPCKRNEAYTERVCGIELSMSGFLTLRLGGFCSSCARQRSGILEGNGTARRGTSRWAIRPCRRH
ncbi:unnamed protein product [Effrenium voratum]|nr:unnamed protein product [Effrenium voratum]